MLKDDPCVQSKLQTILYLNHNADEQLWLRSADTHLNDGKLPEKNIRCVPTLQSHPRAAARPNYRHLLILSKEKKQNVRRTADTHGGLPTEQSRGRPFQPAGLTCTVPSPPKNTSNLSSRFAPSFPHLGARRRGSVACSYRRFLEPPFLLAPLPFFLPFPPPPVPRPPPP